MADKMVCPWCVADGEKSSLTMYGGFVTAMGWQPYYDEDGNYHAHNPNGSGTNLQCSRGHHFYPASKPCPSCDYHERPARLFAVDCTASGRTVENEGRLACPECGMEVVTISTWEYNDMSAPTSITIERHWPSLPEAVDAPEIASR
jgi:hypothetical protein